MSEALTLEAFTKLLLTHSSNEYESNDCSYCSDTESSVMASAAQERAEESGAALIAAYDEQRSRADTAEAERDAARKRVDKLEAFITYIESPALKAWRGLDAEERANTVEDLKTWADLVERGLGDGGRGSHRGLSVAADCLEALAERP